MARRQISLRCALLITALVAIALTLHSVYSKSRLWRNAYFHSDIDGIITLPSGEQLKTNTWATTSLGFPLAHQGTGVWRDGREELYLLQSPGNSKIATIEVDGVVYNAVVTAYTAHGPDFYCEYWVRPENWPPGTAPKP